jgi:hypothetical protein
MDPVFVQVLVGVLTNAFSSVVEKSWSSATKLDIEAVVEAAAQDVVDSIEGDPALEGSKDLLLHPEATTLVRMLFVARANDLGDTTEELRGAFVRIHRRYVPDVSEAGARALFDLLVGAAQGIFEEAARYGDPEAAEAMAAIRFRRLAEEIQGLNRSLEALESTKDEDIDAYLEWESSYRDQVTVRHGTIIPPSFDTADRVPIDEIYVESRFRTTSDGDIESPLSPADLVANLDRMVILGDPGAGKSTFAKKLAYDLAKERVTLPGGALTPLVVTLKDYAAEKSSGRVSLVEWIESISKTDYSVPPPAGAIPYLLAAGRAVVVFDGLDELLDTSYRREITADIETFAARFVAAPMLVTSRRIGYSQAPLDPRRFDLVYLTELANDQVQSYAEMWFSLRKELTEEERSRMAVDFMRDSAEGAADLRSNALMLALLCNIYRGDGYIPRQRPQVYEKCAVMLFERWDRGRRIEVTLEFERHLRPAMQHLAFWIYSEPGLRGGVTEADLVRSATEYLMGRRFDDVDAARQEARSFVEFCRGRAWVFTDTGTTADGENLYQFTHRTFLEFFAAEHLVRTHATPASLGGVLYPRIQRGEWDVVAQLAFQLQDNNIDGAADELLIGLLSSCDQEDDRDPSLSFAARSLSFLVPTRATCRAVAKAVVLRAYEVLMELPRSDPNEPRWSLLGEEVAEDASAAGSFSALVNLDRENFEPVAETLADEVMRAVEADPSLRRAEAGLEIGPNADMAVRSVLSPEVYGRWREQGKPVFERMWPLLQGHLQESDDIAFDAVYFGVMDVEEAVRSRSVRVLFDSRHFDLYGNYIRSSLVEYILWGALGQRRRPGGAPMGSREEMEKLGVVLAEADPPWYSTEVGHTGLEQNFRAGSVNPLDPDLEGHSLFAGFALLATIAEYIESLDDFEEMVAGLRESKGWPRLLLPWIVRPFAVEMDEDLPDLPMGTDLRALVSAWSEGQWIAIQGRDDGN